MSYQDTDSKAEVCNNLLVKLASRCNIACRYCYWFRDKTVYASPPVMTPDVEAALIEKLERHIVRHQLTEFSILFHGGEPMLFGKKRFRILCAALAEVSQGTGCKIPLSLMTNGMLIDDEWITIFREFNVRLGISIDGPEDIHDRNRVDFKGRGTHALVLAGISKAQSAGLNPGVLAVCNPADEPEKIISYFVDDLGIMSFDILVPDATHEDKPPSISAYYKSLFDIWYRKYSGSGVEVRYLSSLLRGLLWGHSGSQVIGYGPISSVTLLTDGSLEALDTLRIAGDGSTSGTLNIRDHEIQSIETDPLWHEIYQASVSLAPACEACLHRDACGGGHIASRWSNERRYDNPSVYCADIKEIIRHIWSKVAPDLYIEVKESDYECLVSKIEHSENESAAC